MQLQQAVLTALQDAAVNTRLVGRQLYAALARRCPRIASQVLQQVDAGLQQKLHAAVACYPPGQPVLLSYPATNCAPGME